MIGEVIIRERKKFHHYNISAITQVLMKVFRVLVKVSLFVVMVTGVIMATVHDVPVSTVVIAMVVSLVIAVVIISFVYAVLRINSLVDL